MALFETNIYYVLNTLQIVLFEYCLKFTSMHIIMKSQKEAIAHKVVRFPFKAKAYLGPPSTR